MLKSVLRTVNNLRTKLIILNKLRGVFNSLDIVVTLMSRESQRYKIVLLKHVYMYLST